MIEVLLPPPFIAARRLKMAVVKRTNPNVHPCRWNHQRTDALERMPIPDNPTFGGAITKPAPASLAANAPPLIGDVAQTDDLRRLRRSRHGGVRVDTREYAQKRWVRPLWRSRRWARPISSSVGRAALGSVHFQSGGTTSTSSLKFGTRVERVPPNIFTRREIPVPVRTSQTWLRRFNSAFALAVFAHGHHFAPRTRAAEYPSLKRKGQGASPCRSTISASVVKL